MSKPRILGITGSLRAGAFSTQVLEGLKAAVADRADVVIHSLGDVPLYNQDLDVGAGPDGVARLRDAIGEADGIVIVTPEFNYSIPGVVKNALDWASRPYGAAKITGKLVLPVTESPAFTGGVRAYAPLSDTLHAIGARTLHGPQVVIGSVHEKLQDGKLTDAATLDFLTAQVDALIAALPKTLAQAA